MLWMGPHLQLGLEPSLMGVVPQGPQSPWLCLGGYNYHKNLRLLFNALPR